MSALAANAVIFKSLFVAVIVGLPVPENVSVAPFPLKVPFPVALNAPVTANPVEVTDAPTVPEVVVLFAAT